jgi:hypothetical protein
LKGLIGDLSDEKGVAAELEFVTDQLYIDRRMGDEVTGFVGETEFDLGTPALLDSFRSGYDQVIGIHHALLCSNAARYALAVLFKRTEKHYKLSTACDHRHHPVFPSHAS